MTDSNGTNDGDDETEGNNIYQIGYGKPPKHSRFQPGKSGNPKGRDKASRGIKADLEAELKSTYTTYVNKQAFKGSKQRLTLKMLAMRAASGDLKAAQLLLPLIIRVLGTEDRGSSRRSLSPVDEAILNELLGGSEESSEPDPDGPLPTVEASTTED